LKIKQYKSQVTISKFNDFLQTTTKIIDFQMLSGRSTLFKKPRINRIRSIFAFFNIAPSATKTRPVRPVCARPVGHAKKRPAGRPNAPPHNVGCHTSKNLGRRFGLNFAVFGCRFEGLAVDFLRPTKTTIKNFVMRVQSTF
jgi:hypothetical protein